MLQGQVGMMELEKYWRERETCVGRLLGSHVEELDCWGLGKRGFQLWDKLGQHKVVVDHRECGGEAHEIPGDRKQWRGDWRGQDWLFLVILLEEAQHPREQAGRDYLRIVVEEVVVLGRQKDYFGGKWGWIGFGILNNLDGGLEGLLELLNLKDQDNRSEEHLKLLGLRCWVGQGRGIEEPDLAGKRSQGWGLEVVLL